MIDDQEQREFVLIRIDQSIDVVVVVVIRFESIWISFIVHKDEEFLFLYFFDYDNNNNHHRSSSSSLIDQHREKKKMQNSKVEFKRITIEEKENYRENKQQQRE